ncbi:hypothetical protein ACFLV5_02030 [Chloroflexota bacterium]
MRETRNTGSLKSIGVEGTIRGNIRFHWEDATGNRHYFSEVTQKQARSAARAGARLLLNQDDIRIMCSSALKDMQVSDTPLTVEAIKGLRHNVSTWFDQLHPANRQIKIGLVIVTELADRLISQLIKYVEEKQRQELTIRWEVEFLPDDGGIYHMLLKVGKNEGIHNN